MSRNETQPTHTDSLSLRLDKKLADRLAALAEKNERSVSAEARIAIRERLEREAA